MNICFFFGILIILLGIISILIKKNKKEMYGSVKNRYSFLNIIFLIITTICISVIYFFDIKNMVYVLIITVSLLSNFIIINYKIDNKKNIDEDIIFENEGRKNIIVTDKIKANFISKECIFIYNLYKEKIIINTELQKKIEYSEKELENMKLKELITEESLDKIKKIVTSKKNFSHLNFKIKLKNNKGEENAFLFIGEVIVTPQGKIAKGVVREFYKINDPEFVLRRAVSNIFINGMKEISMVVVDKNLNYKIISHNHKEKIKQRLNINIEEGMNLTNILEMFLIEDEEIKSEYSYKMRKKLNKVLLGEKVNMSQIFWTKGNNKEFYSIEAIPVKLEIKEEILGALIIFQDRTENENMKKDLIKSKERAISANNAKSKFLANVSHEIRTPMNGILGMADLLLNSELNEKQKYFIKTIQESAKSLLEIINNILDLSKIEAEKFNVEKEIFHFYDLMNRVKEMFIIRQIQSKINIKYTIDKNIPSFLIGDEIKLQRILVNLIGNSLKFTTKGEINVKVKLIEKVICDTNLFKIKLKFNVIDTGIGIPKEKLNDIFESFTQVEDCYEKNYRGTGLGLTITKQLLELMGGDIKVESETGEGSNFEFSIILETAPNDNIRNFKINKSDCLCNDFLREKKVNDTDLKILVAEDNVINQLVIKEMIKNQGWNCEIVENGLKAVEYLKNNEVDIILMDVSMPVMDGVKAMKIIKNEMKWINAPVIALTAHAIIDDKEKFLKLGMDSYLTKPIDQKKLCTMIKKYSQVKNIHIKEVVNNDFDEYSKGFERITKVLDGNIDLVVCLAEKIISMLSKNQLMELKNLIEKEDIRGLKERIHFIKGAISNFQLESIKKILEKIYEYTVKGEIEKAFQLILEIEIKVEEFKQKLNVYKYKCNYFKDIE